MFSDCDDSVCWQKYFLRYSDSGALRIYTPSVGMHTGMLISELQVDFLVSFFENRHVFLEGFGKSHNFAYASTGEEYRRFIVCQEELLQQLRSIR